MATYGAPKRPRAAQRDPIFNATQSQPKERNRTSKDTQRRATSHEILYTLTKSAQAPDPPPYTGRLVLGCLLIAYCLRIDCILLSGPKWALPHLPGQVRCPQWCSSCKVNGRTVQDHSQGPRGPWVFYASRGPM